MDDEIPSSEEEEGKLWAEFCAEQDAKGAGAALKALEQFYSISSEGDPHDSLFDAIEALDFVFSRDLESIQADLEAAYKTNDFGEAAELVGGIREKLEAWANAGGYRPEDLVAEASARPLGQNNVNEPPRRGGFEAGLDELPSEEELLGGECPDEEQSDEQRKEAEKLWERLSEMMAEMRAELREQRMARLRGDVLRETANQQMRHSRFRLHYIFPDIRDASLKMTRKLKKLLETRFPEDKFLEVPIPYPSQRAEGPLPDVALETAPASAAHALFIGIGTGSTVASKVQKDPSHHGASLIAVCPPPGIGPAPEAGPRVVLCGSKTGMYSIYSAEGFPFQEYGIPTFIHGPGLVLYATAYLVGAYMEGESLEGPLTSLFGEPPEPLTRA